MINNWLYKLDAVLTVGAATLPIPVAGLERLALSSGVTYDLTITSALAKPDGSDFEVIRVTGMAEGYSVERGREGTVEREWPAGSLILCSLTAGAWNALLYRLGTLQARLEALEGHGSPARLVDGAGNSLISQTGDALTPGGQ